MPEVTPEEVNKIADTIEDAADNPTVEAVEDVVKAKLPPKARRIIYRVGKWLGLAGTFVAGGAALLDGNVSLWTGAIGGALLAVSTFIADAHLDNK